MSKTRIEKLKCPKCGHEQKVTVWDSIEVADSPEAKEKIISGDLFLFTCEECGNATPMIHTSLYHDKEKKLLVYVIPDYDKEQQEKFKLLAKDMGDLIPEDKRDGYEERMVFNANSLKEKVLLREADLDDRVIELMKLYYIANAQQQLGDKEIGEVLFESLGGVNGFVFLMKEGNPFFAEIDMEAYDTLREDMKENLDKETGAGFAQIDWQWAQNVTEKYLSED
ncbi:MAG: CpXC domain-containing protein [Bacillota bacterium]|nr:CpXC domain-containing protein [Bacillota bacterium]